MKDRIEAALEAATRDGCACDCERVQPGCLRIVASEIATFLVAIDNKELADKVSAVSKAYRGG